MSNEDAERALSRSIWMRRENLDGTWALQSSKAGPKISEEARDLQAGNGCHAGTFSATPKIADILEAAVAAACGIDGLGKKDEPSEAAIAIQGYLDRGGSLESLQQKIYHSYLVVNDPSLIAVWLENMAREAEINRINKEKADAKLEVARLELADDQKKIQNLQKISGNKPQE